MLCIASCPVLPTLPYPFFVRDMALPAQALQPFIDRHTARKIIFVTRADHNNDALSGYLAPDTLAACGVGVRDWKFDLGAYARVCQALEQRGEAAEGKS